MPGPVSDSHDPEWGTGAKADEIRLALRQLYHTLSDKLGGRPPIYIGDLVDRIDLMDNKATATFSEWELRILRFSLERALETI